MLDGEERERGGGLIFVNENRFHSKGGSRRVPVLVLDICIVCDSLFNFVLDFFGMQAPDLIFVIYVVCLF